MKTIIALTISLFFLSPMFARGAVVKTNWDNDCAQCHGKGGRADMKIGKLLSAKDLTDRKVQAEFTDAKPAQSIKEGVKQNGKMTMNAFGGKLTDDKSKHWSPMCVP